MLTLSVGVLTNGAGAAEDDSNGGHHFTPHWSKTVNDKQKREIDQMHLELNRELYVLRQQVGVKQAELNALAAQADPDLQAIHDQIDELMEVKAEILRHRYDHIVEMREILTPEQRLSYDMDTLGRAGIGGDH